MDNNENITMTFKAKDLIVMEDLDTHSRKHYLVTIEKDELGRDAVFGTSLNANQSPFRILLSHGKNVTI